MELKCPHCQNHQNIDFEQLDWLEGDEKEIKCRNCDEVYIGKCEIVLKYFPHKKEDLS